MAGGMDGGEACVAGDMQGKTVGMARGLHGGVCGRGHVCQGGRGAVMAGGTCGTHPLQIPRDTVLLECILFDAEKMLLR